MAIVTVSCERNEPDSVKVSNVVLNKTSLVLTVGESEILTATVLPDNVEDKNVLWSSSSESVASVDANGKVIAITKGTAIITATAGNKKATCEVTINPILVSSVIINKNDLTLNVGDSEILVATVLPEDAEDKNVTWSSSTTSIATVDANGKVTAIAKGTAVITATAGNKKATCDVTATEKDVYVVGIVDDRAMIWKNGTVTALTNGSKSSSANSIFISENDIYVAGRDNGYVENSLLKYDIVVWKNGVRTSYGAYSSPYSNIPIFLSVANSDVYISTLWYIGYIPNSYSLYYPIILKNGQQTKLTSESGNYSIGNVFVSANDVYVVGNVDGNATLWKNGVPNSFGNNTSAQFVYVANNDVYVLGYKDDKIVIWKNGNATVLTNAANAYVRSIFVYDNNLYVVGSVQYLYRVATIWKNGELTSLGDGTKNTYANSIFVSGNDVFVVGSEEDKKAVIWKNGIASTLAEGAYSAKALSVFVK